MSSSAELFRGLEDMSVKGGSDIGVVAAAALQAYALENLQSNGQFFNLVEQYGQRLKTLKPSMASVHNIIDQMIRVIHETDLNTSTGQETLNQLVADYKSKMEADINEIACLCANIIDEGDIILTHSFTKSVLNGLEKASSEGKHFRVICNESRPLREGAYLAAELARRGIQATVIIDAAMAHYLPECTKVMVGADALYTDGTIVNKMGTLALAILANVFHKPVYVLSITSKLYLPSLKGFRLQLERRPATEIQDRVSDETVSRNLDVENTFFEEVSGEYTTYLVTEKGVIKPCQLFDAARS